MSDKHDDENAAEKWPDVSVTVTKRDGKLIEDPNAEQFAAHLKRLLDE